MNPVKSLRARYVLGLGALAILLIGLCWHMQVAIDRQAHSGRVIMLASNQVGLSNRIAFFVGVMAAAKNADDYNVARNQLGRALNLMRKRHGMLLQGDPEVPLPKITTPLLQTIYFDPSFGLDRATKLFTERAEDIYRKDFGELSLNDSSYIFIVNYGPYVLETLLEAAVVEYEAYAEAENTSLKRTELFAMGVAVLLLLVEAMFIFRPLERRVKTAFSALRESRDALAREKRAAGDANRAKTDFLSNMSHELRTPLNAIIGFSDCLTHQIYGPIANDQQRATLNDIKMSGEHLLRLVNDILDISAAEAGAISLKEKPAELGAIIRSSMLLVMPLAGERGVQVTESVTGKDDLQLRCDPDRIRQVVVNLLANSVKFTEAGGDVTIVPSRTPDGWAGFAVTDTGVGMTADEITLARERFGQVDVVRRRRHKGTGLGLPVAIELIRLHDGELEIESEKGKGTTVSVLFPPARVDAQHSLHLIAGG